MLRKHNENVSLEEVERELTAVEEEQNSRVASFARVKFDPSYETHAKSEE